MTTIHSDDVRIPRAAREAVARHERVVVLNHERPVLALVHPDDLDDARSRRRGRRLGDVVAAMAVSATADPAFVDDMRAVRAAVGPMPEPSWEPS